MASSLKDKIRNLIQFNGPISVADYFSLCLADPEFGYYKTKEPFGSDGDFITAPEISQLFGEMLGIFLIQSWQKHNPVGPIRLVELGPGRGTLMADILRVITRTNHQGIKQISIHMIETSPKLRDIQANTLTEYNNKIFWHDRFEDVPEGFTLILANELFDAIPIQQFVKIHSGFHERMITLDDHDKLAFSIGYNQIDPELLPLNHNQQPAGTIFEISPQRARIMASIASRLDQQGGSALIIDYGHMVGGFGDTLQAIHQHNYDLPLNNPGIADLTSHVNFEPLVDISHTCGAHIHGLMRQGDFLIGLGLLQRANALGYNKAEQIQHEIKQAVTRLSNEGEGNMGELFKVLAISGSPVQLAPFIMNDPVDKYECHPH